ncbi:MAG: hypothetical protein ACLGI6_02455 [Gammaproteobacteria bacterium]
MIQRTLHYDLAPDAAAPLRFLLSAPLFALAAAALIVAWGPDLLLSRWAGPTLAVTHLLTLGYLAMAAVGAAAQLIPVVTGTSLQLAGPYARLTWGMLCAGAGLVALGFARGLPTVLATGGVLAASALLAVVALALRALLRPVAAPALPMARAMRMAWPALGATALLGAFMSVGMAGGAALPYLALTGHHALWGLVGFAALLIVGVGFQVIPMFQAVAPYHPALVRTLPWGLLAGLVMWSGMGMAGAWIAILLAGFAALTLWKLAQRRRGPDGSTLYWRLSLASVIGCAALYLTAPQSLGLELAMGILFIGGFVMGAVNAMLYRIVPFLLWYELQQNVKRRAGAASNAPSIRNVLPLERAERQFYWHAAGLGLLLAALVWPVLSRPAGLVLTAAGLLLVRDLHGAARRCRRMQADARAAVQSS